MMRVINSARQGIRTLNTCRQFLPLSFSRLSSISIISTKWSLREMLQTLRVDG